MKLSLSGEREASEDDAPPYYSFSSSYTVSLDVSNHPLPSGADLFLRNKHGLNPFTTSFSLFIVVFRELASKLLISLLLVHISCIIRGSCNGLVVGAMSCNISAGELIALEALYNATNGDSWDWISPASSYGSIWTFPASVSDPCTSNWQGVNCSLSHLPSSSCYVDSVVLRNYNLQGGSLPKEISRLTGLSTLDLGHNSITGAIPMEVSALATLQDLDLSFNLLSGQIPSQVANLKALQSLTLSDNELTGSIPSYLSTKLLYLDIISNFMNGIIPSELYFMTALQLLRIFNNFFSGSISSSISNMINLGKISLASNQFTGSIPTEIASLTKLYFLNLKTNQLNGTIPSQLSKLTGLTVLGLSTNQLKGTIPNQLSVLTGLTVLDLYTNQLSGTILSQLSELTGLTQLGLNANQLNGAIPSQLSKLTDLEDLEVNSNRLTGTIPSQLSSLINMQFLYLNGNKLRGTLPSWLSTFTNLSVLYLGDNEFRKDAFPDIFSSLTKLNALSLTGISLTGTLPVSLSKLSYNLTLFDVSNNALSGSDPFFFMRYPKIQLVNISHNRFEYDVSNLQSSAMTSPSLEYLDISSNKFYGSLPDDVGRLLPSLVFLSSSNNCLWSYIPASLCASSNLTTLLLNKLGSECPFSSISHTLFSDDSEAYSIPSCLLQLPELQTAHFVSNALYGSLGEIGPKMTSLSLVGNLLWGTIPRSVQTSTNLNNLQLSINRFSGTLRDDAFANMPLNSTINLYSNRLSGNISNVKSLGKFSKKVDILSGNVFSCSDGKPPTNDARHDTYSCGTSSFDYYKYVYSGVGAILLCSVSIYLWFRFVSNGNGNISSSTNKRHIFVEYFEARAFPSDLYLSLVSPQFLFACLSIALLMTFINLGLNSSSKYWDFDTSYSTVVNTYGWTSTFVYVHGVGPYLLVVLGLSLLLYVFVKYFDQSDDDGGSKSYSTGNGSDSKAHFSQDRPSSISLPWDTKSPIVLRCKGKIKYLCDFFFHVLSSLVSSKENIVLVALQLLNIVLVTGVNVLYVLVENNYKGKYINLSKIKYKVLVPIALGTFKTLWANSYVYYIAQYGVRSKLSVQSVFFNYYFAMVYIFVLVPIVTVYVTDVDCFYYPIPGFGQIGKITEDTTSLIPLLYCLDTITCENLGISIVGSDTPTYQFITPIWTYGYQCGLTILKKYVPALLSTYTIRGIVLPVIKLFLLSLSPSNPIRNFRIVKYLLPYTVNAMKETDFTKDGHRELRTLDYLMNLQIDMLMLLTFGIICPFMSLLILFTMVVTEVVDHMQVGSYLYDKVTEIDKDFNDGALAMKNKKGKGEEEGVGKMKEMTKEGANDAFCDACTATTTTSTNTPSFSTSTTTTSTTITITAGTRVISSDKQDAILAQFNLTSRIHLDNSRDLVLSIWKPNLLVILFFMQLILFDVIADVYFIKYGLVAVSICFMWIWFIFWDRMERMSYFRSSVCSMFINLLAFGKELMRKYVEDSSINSSKCDSTQVQVELSDVKNPISFQSSL